tara:strand:- start:44195 stop:44506 length:312 start_codon:yes stop_codon:yes gene_type:complete
MSDSIYRYSEDKILKELKEYIDSTYKQHYSKNKFQATEFIMDSGHGEGFCIGNIMKYAQRFGKKDGKNRKDLLKVIHYGIMALHNLDNGEVKDETKQRDHWGS